MAILQNPRHEKFAQALAEGKNQLEAYAIAGYSPHTGNASKLASDKSIVERVAELQQRIANITQKATAKAFEIAVEKYAVTKERVIGELARIGFANMLDYIVIGEDGLPYLDFSAVDRDKGSAIQEVTVEMVPVTETLPDGEKKVVQVRKARFKLADKRAALVDLGKQLGLFKDHVEHSYQPSTAEEAWQRVFAQIQKMGLSPEDVFQRQGVVVDEERGTAH
jgi:phage terminase small subunit